MLSIPALALVASYLAHPLLPASRPAQGASSATSGQPSTVETSPFVDNDFPALLRNLKVRSTDLLEASLSVEDKGAKLTYAPFLYGVVNYRPVLSETRLSISQSNGVTTMGIGATYDPASPRSSLGNRLWLAEPPTSKPAAGYVLALRNAANTLAKELEATQREAADAVQSKDTVKRDALFKKISDLKPRADALKAEADRALAGDTQEEAQRIAKFYRKLLEANKPVVSGSFTTSLFGSLGGTQQDANHNGLADTAHKVKNRGLTLSVDLPFRTYLPSRKDPDSGETIAPASWQWLQFSGAITTEWQRGSQEEGTPFAQVIGFGLSGGGIVKILNRDFEITQDYKDSFFIPSISAGVSFERKQCTSDDKAFCPDSIESQAALTPFVDIRVTKAAQFRFGTPLKFTRKVAGGGGKDFGLLAVYAIQLGAPK